MWRTLNVSWVVEFPVCFQYLVASSYPNCLWKGNTKNWTDFWKVDYFYERLYWLWISWPWQQELQTAGDFNTKFQNTGMNFHKYDSLFRNWTCILYIPPNLSFHNPTNTNIHITCQLKKSIFDIVAVSFCGIFQTRLVESSERSLKFHQFTFSSCW